jgi:hypothetical protein
MSETKMGRPPKEINWVEFEKLCALQCTQEEFCGWFDMCSDTLNAKVKEHYGKSFSEVFKLKKGTGKVSLRRTLWKQAEKSPAAAIWLSKQHLGMTDKQEVQQQVEVKSFEIVSFDEQD